MDRIFRTINKKAYLIFIGVLILIVTSGCGSDDRYDPEANIDQNELIGTWESENETEKVVLTLNSDNTFIFEGIGFSDENNDEVTLTETGNYVIDGNLLSLDIQDVSSSGLIYEQYTSEDLGYLNFYIEEYTNNNLNLIEENENVYYNLIKAS